MTLRFVHHALIQGEQKKKSCNAQGQADIIIMITKLHGKTANRAKAVTTSVNIPHEVPSEDLFAALDGLTTYAREQLID